ncbi:hypothetical protein [Paenibacillus thiaminolyticus]|uniref:hypothetical protein n=1 Tax=Paenibacillus thiaminolyticus TaxID=49283 RepID=UPI0025428189|nr:hypothetical protein [Paenibacillus thiaminolyticus]WII35281.1 hypothetical protein O0V01_16385 [Paenibacillus thiaminolyticus]
MMFTVFKKEKTMSKEMECFLQQEKKRHKKADDFIQMMTEIVPYVAEEVWGTTDQEIQVSDTVRFDLVTKRFLSVNTGTELDVLLLKGQSFWQSVQQIMNFAHDLLDDIREREEGRNQLVSDMASLTQRMKESPIVGMKAKLFRV